MNVESKIIHSIAKLNAERRETYAQDIFNYVYEHNVMQNELDRIWKDFLKVLKQMKTAGKIAINSKYGDYELCPLK